MDDSQFSDFLESDEFNGEEPDWLPTTRDGVIFLIDCTATMISEKVPEDQVREDAYTGVKLALLCCRNFMQNKALSSPDDMVGLVFMRTSTSNSSEFKRVNIVQTLDQTDAPRILEVEKLQEMDPEKFDTVYGSLPAGESYPVHEALWACQNIFNKVKKTLGYKRIFLITDDPDPVGNKDQLKRQAILKASDLRQSGIDIEVIPIQQEGVDFQMSTFYDSLLVTESEIDSAPTELMNSIDKLLTWEKSQEPGRRRLGSLPLYLVPMTPTTLSKMNSDITPTLAFGVSAYCLVRRAPFPKSVRMYSKTNETVVSKRRFYKVGKDGKPDLDNIVMPQDIEKGLRVGSRTLRFEQNEVSGRVRQIIPIGIHLLGFKPLDKLKPWCQTKATQFLYPEETMAKDSTLWFTTLLSSCLRKKVFGVALYVQRQGSQPHLVALVPQAEELDENGGQVASPGFHILYLPFREDFRKLVLPKHLPAGSEEVNAAKEVIKKMSTKYYPDAISNPTLQKYYAELEALALERTEVNEVVDHTQPNVERIQKHAGKEIGKFIDLISQAGGDTPFASSKKTATSVTTLTLKELQDHAESGTLAKLTVPVLKQCITMLKVKPASNKKADLLAAIVGYFDT